MSYTLIIEHVQMQNISLYCDALVMNYNEFIAGHHTSRHGQDDTGYEVVSNRNPSDLGCGHVDLWYLPVHIPHTLCRCQKVVVGT